MDWLQLQDRPCLVIGAGGLGGATAAALASVGARVLLVDVSDDNLQSVRARVRAAGSDVDTMNADLRDPEACRRTVVEACRRLGRIDVFVHAIGVNHRIPVAELSDDTWSQVVTLNLSTAYWLGQAVGRLMCKQAYGRIVFMSSVSGQLAHRHHAPYAATKGGLNQLMRVMAREWAAHNVTVNAVAPGYVETDLTRGYLAQEGVRDELTSLVPAGRLGMPEDVANAVVFLTSDRAAFVTGHVLYIDGGRVLV